MKNTNTKKNKINIIFSSFIIIGYIVCAHFFSTLASQVAGTLGSLIQILILAVFGLLLFWSTRVGEGKQIRRFSLAVLLLVDLPALYIILASLVPALPFHDVIAPQSTMALMGLGGVSAPSVILTMACVALGYGVPYTFFSGYEMKDEEEEAAAEGSAPIEGGIAEELAETEAETNAAAEAAGDAVEETAEKAVDEATVDAVEEAAEEAAPEEDKADDAEATEEKKEEE